MILESVYKDIIASFGSLWSFKERENTLEIITPFATTSHKFVSIFLTKREDDFIVSDGGWLYDGGYDNIFDLDIGCFSKIFEHYKDTFDIKETKSKSGTTYYYKKTNKLSSVPSLVFDLANFISSIGSANNVKFDDKEAETENKFAKQAKDFLNKKVITKKSKNEVYYNEYLDSKREVKVNVIIRKPNSKLVLLNFITGSTYGYFRTNISKTNIIFELAKKTNESQMIENKIALLDNTAKGYSLDRISIWLEHLITNTQSQKVEWKDKKELTKI